MNRIVLLALATTLVACATTPPPPPPAADPVLEAGRLTLIDQTLSSFTARATATVSNPGPEPLILERVAYTLSLEGEPVREGSHESAVTVPPGQSASFEVPVAVEHALSPEQIQELAGTESLAVLFDGRIEARSGEARFELDLDRVARLRPPRLPKVGLGTVDAARQRLDAIAATFRLQLTNDNPFEVRVGRFNYVLTVEGQVVSEDSLAVGARVAPSATLSYEVSVDLTPQTVPGLVETLKARNALDYTLTGTLHIGDLAIPVDERAQIKFAADRGS